MSTDTTPASIGADALREALKWAAAAVPHAQMTEEIDNILSDPDTRLSPGAERALSWLRTWTDAPLVLAAAPKAEPAATNDCTRSHPHEAMSAECQVRAVIAEMRSKEARGAEATEHELGEMADRRTRALEQYDAALASAAQRALERYADLTRPTGEAPGSPSESSHDRQLHLFDQRDHARAAKEGDKHD